MDQEDDSFDLEQILMACLCTGGQTVCFMLLVPVMFILLYLLNNKGLRLHGKYKL